MSLNGAVYFTPLPPTYQEKKEEQISSSIVFPLSLFSHSQILFTVELEVSQGHLVGSKIRSRIRYKYVNVDYVD